MGLFSRGKSPDSDNLFDDNDLPGSDDLNESFVDGREQTEPTIEIPEKPAAKPSHRYGIEDAIALMRRLPKDDTEVVVTVVNKTLESIQIQVADIIQDAATKETRLREQHKKLETEIRDLQREIERRNKQIAELLADLKETSEVSQRLQLALELEKKAKPAARPPEPETKAKPSAGGGNPAGQTARKAPPPGPATQQRPAGEQPNPKH